MEQVITQFTVKILFGGYTGSDEVDSHYDLDND